jgi:hypothetical protein
MKNIIILAFVILGISVRAQQPGPIPVTQAQAVAGVLAYPYSMSPTNVAAAIKAGGGSITNAAQVGAVAFTKYVSASIGSDSTGTGSQTSPYATITNAVAKSATNYLDLFVSDGSFPATDLVFSNYNRVRIVGNPLSPFTVTYGLSITNWTFYHNASNGVAQIWSAALPSNFTNQNNLITSFGYPNSQVFEVGTPYGTMPINPISQLAMNSTLTSNHGTNRMGDTPLFNVAANTIQTGDLNLLSNNAANASWCYTNGSLYVILSDGGNPTNGTYPNGRTIQLASQNSNDVFVTALNCQLVDLENFNVKWPYTGILVSNTPNLYQSEVGVEGGLYIDQLMTGQFVSEIDNCEFTFGGNGLYYNGGSANYPCIANTKNDYMHDCYGHLMALIGGVNGIHIGDIYAYCTRGANFAVADLNKGQYKQCHWISNTGVAAIGSDGGTQLNPTKISLDDCTFYADYQGIIIGNYSYASLLGCSFGGQNYGFETVAPNSTIEFIAGNTIQNGFIIYTNGTLNAIYDQANAIGTLGGNGSGLTSLNASQLTSGTVPVSALTGVTITNAFITNSVFAGDGRGLTNLNLAAVNGIISNSVSTTGIGSLITANTSSSTSWNTISALAPNLTIGSETYLSFGKAGANYNWGGFGFYYAGNSSISNRLGFSFFGTSDLWTIDGNGSTTNQGDSYTKGNITTATGFVDKGKSSIPTNTATWTPITNDPTPGAWVQLPNAKSFVKVKVQSTDSLTTNTLQELIYSNAFTGRILISDLVTIPLGISGTASTTNVLQGGPYEPNSMFSISNAPGISTGSGAVTVVPDNSTEIDAQ